MPTDNGYTFGTDREVLNLKPQEKSIQLRQVE
jgi:hypothetical protein